MHFPWNSHATWSSEVLNSYGKPWVTLPGSPYCLRLSKCASLKIWDRWQDCWNMGMVRFMCTFMIEIYTCHMQREHWHITHLDTIYITCDSLVILLLTKQQQGCLDERKPLLLVHFHSILLCLVISSRWIEAPIPIFLFMSCVGFENVSLVK